MRKLHGYLKSRFSRSKSRKERPAYLRSAAGELLREFWIAGDLVRERGLFSEKQVAEKCSDLPFEVTDVAYCDIMICVSKFSRVR
jgi:hypothetical protein